MSEDRKLATIERIVDVRPIEGADNIELATVRGWQLVTQKANNFKPGDKVVYFEIDSFLDVEDEHFAFLAPRGVRTNADGLKGHVLKTIRLKGQYSQGLILPLTHFGVLAYFDFEAGTDVSELLGVKLWEPPIPANLRGVIKGHRPAWIGKTDEERVQNMPPEIFDIMDDFWIPTEKIDGTSITVWTDGDELGVCSRNMDLKEDENNVLWKVAKGAALHAIARQYGEGKIALQGEVFGEGIQKNPLGIKSNWFRLFNVIVDGIPIPRMFWTEACLGLSVPWYGDIPVPKTIDEALAQVDSLPSIISPDRKAEGIVWRHGRHDLIKIDGVAIRASFKVISNRYAMKNDS